MLYWRVMASPGYISQLQQIPVDQLSRLIINQGLWSQLNELQQQTIRTIHLKQSQLMQLQKGSWLVVIVILQPVTIWKH